jgi:nicotinate phosphoribosyltransferase
MTVRLLARDFTDAEDLYNYTMGCLARRWPEARVRYRYVNRDGAYRFRPGFSRELTEQIEGLTELRFSEMSYEYFRRTMPWLPVDYLEWLRDYRFDPRQVQLKQEGGRLELEIAGRWQEAIYWEIKLLAIMSELAHEGPCSSEERRLPAGWESHIERKAARLSGAGVQWVDFGTRRRYSFEVQDAVVRIMKEYPGFGGTSNPYLARKHGVKAIGTYAHQLPMALQVLYGARDADRMTMEHWQEAYGDALSIALSDTLTTEHFLRSFDGAYARRFEGVRQDSGDPFAFGERLVRHYEGLGIDPRTKIIVFSDSLDTELAVRLHEHFAGRVRTVMGIGTHLTADAAMTGVKPPNHVIKLVEADFGSGPRAVVKLSDDPGKVMGDPALLEDVRKQVGYQHAR